MLSKTTLIIFLFLHLAINAQDNETYDLLWKIEHKESKKTSYLFGTMHLKDNRVFNFSDALLPAIKNTEAFALEVHPDSIFDVFSEESKLSKQKNIYRRILNKDDYERLNQRFMEINGTPLDSFRLKNPYFIESYLQKDIIKEDDRRTFLDGYLYGIANSLKKEIHGLEQIEDQLPYLEKIDDEEIKESILSILDGNDAEYEEMYEEMISIYKEGNINNILDYIAGYDGIDSIMIRRNNVMVNSMKKIMSKKSLFTAVGAAHLPGKNGIIDLLKKEGYEVTRVEAVFTGISNSYEILSDYSKWQKNEDEDLGFRVKMPTDPSPIEINEEYNAMMSLDLISGNNYTYLVLDLRKKTIIKDYDFVDNYIKNQIKGDSTNLIERTDFIKNNVTVSDVILKKKDKYTRLHIAFKDKIVYSFYVENSLKNLKSKDIEYFFESIEFFPPKTIELSNEWQEFDHESGAFSVMFPEGKINNVSREVANPLGEDEEPYFMNMFMVQGVVQETNYFVRYNNQPLGYYIEDEGELEKEMKLFFEEKGTLTKDIVPVEIDGIKGLQFEVLLADLYPTVGKMFFRGNRTYLLMAQKASITDSIDPQNKFFTSFKLKEFKKVEFDSIITFDSNYTLPFFKDSSKEVTEGLGSDSEFKDIISYSTLNKATGGVYLVERTTVKDYLKYKSKKEFYDEYTEVLKEYDDTIVSSKDFIVDGIIAKEVHYKNKKNSLTTIVQLILHDNKIFAQQAYLGDEEINSSLRKDFFNGFKIKNKKEDFNISASKTKLLFKNLKSKDSLTFSDAFGALDYYSFEKEDLPLLFKNLKYNYKNDTLYSGIKTKILSKIKEFGSAKDISGLTKFYLEKDTRDNNKIEIIKTIPKLDSINGFDIYFDLLKNHPPKRIGYNYYNIFQPLIETTSPFKKNTDKVIDLINQTNYRDKVVSLFYKKISSDSIYKSQLEKYKTQLFSYSLVDAEQYADSEFRNENPYLSYSLIDSYIDLGSEFNIKSNEFKEFINTIASIPEPENWLKIKALIASINLNSYASEETILEALESLYSRYEIMEALYKNNKSNLIPSKYIEATAFSKLSIYNSFYDDYPDELNLIGTLKHEGKEFEVFSFHYNYEGDEEPSKYMAVSEKKSPSIEDYAQSNATHRWLEIEEDWKTQALEIIKSLVEKTDE